MESEFLGVECPAGFLTDLDARIAEVEEAANQNFEALGDQVEGTADMKAMAREAIAKVRQLGSVVQARYAARHGVLMEWKSASRIARPPRVQNPAPEVAPAT